MDRLLVASEYTDPSLYNNQMQDALTEASDEADEKGYKIGLLLITKNLYYCDAILRTAKKRNIPTIIHATHTGLAQSVLEPRLETDWYLGLCQGLGIWHMDYPEAKYVLRIDPIIPNHSSEAIIYTMMEHAKRSGVSDVRFSIMDNYPFIRRRFEELSLTVPKTFQYDRKIIHEWEITMAMFAKKLGMNLNVCAEEVSTMVLSKYIGEQGCASTEEWKSLGLNLEPCTFKQRKLCTCTAKKYDLLKGYPCKNDCMYCYYSKDRK